MFSSMLFVFSPAVRHDLISLRLTTDRFASVEGSSGRLSSDIEATGVYFLSFVG